VRQHACAGIGGAAGRSHTRGEGGSRRVRSREGGALGPFAPTSAANGLYRAIEATCPVETPLIWGRE